MSETVPLRLLGVGPQRSGTTWLDTHLRRHPALALPAHVKETFFFDRHWARGLDDYRRHFPPEAESHASGVGWAEVAPTLFDVPEAPGRVSGVAPGVRAVILLRDPVERAVSLYRHHAARGRVGADLWEAASAFPSILTAGDYAEHVERWIGALGRERVYVALLQDVAATPDATLRALTDWAGLAPLAPSPEAGRRVNAGGGTRFPALARVAAGAVAALHAARLHRVVAAGKRLGLNRVYRGGEAPEVSAGVRQRLADRYAPHVAYVERLLQRETGWSCTASPGGSPEA
ncbi:sulfotransferase domain-containing protein [Rubricoccus marinus]|nr:sulfotransferase domain-containing protein [Rubricoccus marinus]